MTDPPRFLEVETTDTVYELELEQCQVEVTGRCNGQCEYCRAVDERPEDVAVAQILKIAEFATKYSPLDDGMVLSGGEPVMHRQFDDILRGVRDLGVGKIFLTTNGTLLTPHHLDLIQSLDFDAFAISVSLDSNVQEEHDAVRGMQGAFEGAVRAITMATARQDSHLPVSVRMTITPGKVPSLHDYACFVEGLGASRLSVSSVIPSGKAASRPDLWMNQDEKKRFLEEIASLKEDYLGRMSIVTNDPLQCLLCANTSDGDEDDLAISGCVAGTTTFNVRADGYLTPCSLLDLPIFDTSHMTVDQIADAYRSAPEIHALLDMRFDGKCGKCDRRAVCGGCRARAYGRTGNYLGEDPDCWV
jgi:radical SAM protein with 4Fe4S-binding SPASM domain